jgi:hypothetical protein
MGGLADVGVVITPIVNARAKTAIMPKVIIFFIVFYLL